jgi:hypothetical protein
MGGVAAVVPVLIRYLNPNDSLGADTTK